MKRRLVMGAAVALVLVAFLVLGIRQWREYQFRSLTSIQHYDKAQMLLYPRTERPPEVQFVLPRALRFSLPSEKALEEAIRHTEAITTEFPKGYEWAAEVLPYLRVARDRPQDLGYMLDSRQRACTTALSAKIQAQLEAADLNQGRCNALLDPKTGKCVHVVCGNYIEEACLGFRTDPRFEYLLAGILEPFPLRDGAALRP